MDRHSEEMKQKIVQRMMPPNNQSVSKLARENGLSETTLYKWKKAAREKGFVFYLVATTKQIDGARKINSP